MLSSLSDYIFQKVLKHALE